MTKKTKARRPRGKKRGGTRFPRQHLEELVKHVESLVRKTFTYEVNLGQLNASVFGLSEGSATGKIRLSSMRQFGLVQGRNKALKASPLAQDIAGSQGEERIRFLQKAFANVRTFADTFTTFAGDQTELAKIESYATAPLGVHPDSAPLFAINFSRSAQVCGLGTFTDDKISLEQSFDFGVEQHAPAAPDTTATLVQESIDDASARAVTSSPGGGHRITIQVDSSMDPEKLEKQLHILRRYGLI